MHTRTRTHIRSIVRVHALYLSFFVSPSPFLFSRRSAPYGDRFNVYSIQLHAPPAMAYHEHLHAAPVFFSPLSRPSLVSAQKGLCACECSPLVMLQTGNVRAGGDHCSRSAAINICASITADVRLHSLIARDDCDPMESSLSKKLRRALPDKCTNAHLSHDFARLQWQRQPFRTLQRKRRRKSTITWRRSAGQLVADRPL